MAITTSNPTATANRLADQAAAYTDRAADSATAAIRTTQSVANEAFDRLTDRVEGVRNTAGPAISRWTDTAEKGIGRVRDTSAQLRDRALAASDQTVGYIRDEPWKAILIAAATGAALMGLMSLLSRSSRRDEY